jgi:hypothetical protein
MQRLCFDAWYSSDAVVYMVMYMQSYARSVLLPAAGDGTNDNFSWNCGVEGRTDNAAVNALRQRQMRNMHLALMVSQGTPMLLIGGWTGRQAGGWAGGWVDVVCLAPARRCAACAVTTTCRLPL